MSSGPQIISAYDGGRHNTDLKNTVSRLGKSAAHKDLSTIIVIPSHKAIDPRIMLSWWGLITPPNNRVAKLVAKGCEVGEAYTNLVAGILANPDLSTWKYLLTLEHDNAPPADGLIKLLAEMEAHPEFAAIGGLYFTKGEGGCAQIWGDPLSLPLNFRPQLPDLNGKLKPCNGTGMGFTVFRLEMFKDPRLRRPWFRTPASAQEGVATQDLYFWADAYKHGYKAAVDCSVKVGHYDPATEMMW